MDKRSNLSGDCQLDFKTLPRTSAHLCLHTSFLDKTRSAEGRTVVLRTPPRPPGELLRSQLKRTSVRSTRSLDPVRATVHRTCRCLHLRASLLRSQAGLPEPRSGDHTVCFAGEARPVRAHHLKPNATISYHSCWDSALAALWAPFGIHRATPERKRLWSALAALWAPSGLGLRPPLVWVLRPLVY